MEPMTFRKKNMELKAWKYEGEKELLFKLQEEYNVIINTDSNTNDVEIKTGEGIYKLLAIGDYIVQGINGEIFPVNAEKFEKEYEPLSDNKISKTKYKKYQDREKTLLLIYPAAIIIFFFLTSIFLYTSTRKNITKIIETAYKEAIERESNKLLEKTRQETDNAIKQAKNEAGAIIAEARIEAQNQAAIVFEEEIQRMTRERIKK